MKAHSHGHHRAALPELAERLRRKSRKMTGPRQAILEILRRQAHPMSTQELFAALPQGGCDRVTVYRSMRLLESLAMVKRFDLGDGVARFELLGEDDDGHHHHLVCTGCATVIEIEHCFISKREQQIAARHGFKAVTHKLEFFGLCPECQRQ